MKTNSEGWSLIEFWRRVNDRLAALSQGEAMYGDAGNLFRADRTVESAVKDIVAFREASPPVQEPPKPASDLPRPILVTDRERDTIIAALRLWQRYPFLRDAGDAQHRRDLVRIAESDRTGDSAALSPAEIDALIETRLNV